MLSNYAFSYLPKKSLIHKLNPAVKIMNIILLLIATFISMDKTLTVLCLGIVLISVLLSQVPMIYYVKNITKLIPLLMILTLILFACNVSTTAVGIIVLKVITIFFSFISLIHTTSTDELLNGIMKVINILNILVINLNRVGIFICQLVNFYPIFYSTQSEVLNSQANRGIDYRYSTIIGRMKAKWSCFSYVLDNTFDKLRVLGITAEQKLFNYNYNRRRPELKNLRFLDLVMLGFYVLLVVFYITRLK